MAAASSLPGFADFDDGIFYERCHRAAVHGDTKNFVIEFDSTRAYAAHNVDDVSIAQLLQLEVNDFANHIEVIKEVTACSPPKDSRLTFINASG